MGPGGGEGKGRLSSGIGKPALASAGEKRSPPPPGKTDAGSPAGKWQRRGFWQQPQVNRGNMPGLQSTFLAMDTEEGVEVVGNELLPSPEVLLLAQQEKIKAPFEQLVGVDHPNIVKVHKYWLDMKGSKAQVISITDYVSSGSLKQFLKKTKKNHKAMSARAWKRWSLFPCSYLHSCNPPITRGYLTSDTIFIQHNRLIKIGSGMKKVGRFSHASYDLLISHRTHGKEELLPVEPHFFPPEYGEMADGTAVDIFSFGMCALEMAVLEIHSNGDSSVTKEAIERARHSLDDPNVRAFILGCLLLIPSQGPAAQDLLFHQVLFEVHSLKLLAAHCFIAHHVNLWPENVVMEKTKELDLSKVMAEIRRAGRLPVQCRWVWYASDSPGRLPCNMEGACLSPGIPGWLQAEILPAPRPAQPKAVPIALPQGVAQRGQAKQKQRAGCICLWPWPGGWGGVAGSHGALIPSGPVGRLQLPQTTGLNLPPPPPIFRALFPGIGQR
uniref:Nuclear receptor binding protein 2 n=1 Tax=Pseudonaja textilis TaxID=8673 RepID=A0A670ZUB1_PSETE